MNEFTMSMFASKEDLYKAKAEYYEKQLRFISEQHWFESEAMFRLNIPETQTSDAFFLELTDAIEREIDAQRGC